MRDNTRNEHIMGTIRVVQASKKITEKRIKWYGHVMRMKQEHTTVRRMLDVEREKKKKRAAKPKVEQCTTYMREAGLKEDNKTNRAVWRDNITSYIGDPR